ncbi:unnamed protein product [Closterium sp. NIES-54]
MDAEMASWKSTGTYVDEVPPSRANIVDGMWIFRVKRPLASPPAFKARYVARGFSQRQGVDYFQTFSPTPKMTTLGVFLHVAAQRDYELHSLDFSTAFLQGSSHEEIWLRRPPRFTGTFPAGTQWSLRRPVYVLVYVDDLVFATADTEAMTIVKSELQKRHTCTDLGELRSYLGLQIMRDRARCTVTLTQSHMMHQVLQRFGFQFSSPQPTPLSTSHSLSAPPSDESVEPSGPYPELVGCLMNRKVHWDAAKRVLRYLCSTTGMGLVLGGRGPIVLTGHADASWVDDSATQWSSQGYTFSLGSGSVSWRSTCSSLVLSSNCEAEIYPGAMAAQELRWLTYLLTDLGEQPRSPLVLGALTDVGAASSLSGKRCSGKGKVGKSGGSGSGGGGGGGSGGGGGGGGCGSGDCGGGSGGFGGGGGGSSGGGGGGSGGSGSGGGGSGGEQGGAVQRGGFWRWLEAAAATSERDPDAILAAIYALFVSAEGDCYLSVPPDPGIEAAALGASESALHGTALVEALHTFKLDSDASHYFFRDSTTLTPLPVAVPVRLADPLRGPVLARSSTVLLCPAVPSSSLSRLHLPSFSMNLLSTAALQDAMVTTTTPGGQRVSIFTCTWTARHCATFTRRPGSSLVAAPCSCRLLSHQNLLWHHRLGHPSLPRLLGMLSRLLFSSLPRSLAPLPPSPAPPCLPCVEGQQRAAPHSSSFPLSSAPLQTLHMDVWGPARVSGQDRARYFLLDLPVLRLHSDRGGEFSSNLLRDFCHGEGILQSFMLPDSPQKNGIAERRFGLVMEVARTSMIHAAAPHFLWPFAVRYAAHQLNLWPRLSLPETSPALRWTGKVGDALVFRVCGSRAFVRDTSADKLSSRASPCVFLGFPPDAPGWVLLPQTQVLLEVLRLEELCLGVAFGGAEPVSAEPRGAEPEGVEPGGAVSEGVESGGAETRGTAYAGGLAGSAAGGTEAGGAGAAGPRGGRTSGTGAAGAGGVGGAGAGDVGAGGSGARGTGSGGAGAGGTGAGAAGASSPRGAGVIVGAGGSGGAGAAGPGGARTRGTRAAGAGGVGGAGAGDPGAGDTRAVGAGAGGAKLETLELEALALEALELEELELEELEIEALELEALELEALELETLDLEVLALGSDLARAAGPTVPRLLATVVTDPSFESTVASALVAKLVDFAAAYRLNYATSLVAEPESECPLSIKVDGMWIFRVKRPLGSPPAFKARYVARGFSQRHGVDFFQTFSPTRKMTTLRVLLHVASQRDYELHSLDFSTAFLQGSLHEEIWLRRPPGFTGLFPAGTKWSLRQPVYSLRQAPREWHDTLMTTLAALGFTPLTADPSLFLRTDTSLPPFYVLVYADDLVFATTDTEALTLVKSELQKRHTCTDLGELRSYLGLQITHDRTRRTITLTQSHMVHQVLQHFGFQFSSPQPTPLSSGHSLSAPPSDESVEPSGPYPELVGCLISVVSFVLCTWFVRRARLRSSTGAGGTGATGVGVAGVAAGAGVTVDLLEQHLLAAETCAVAVGAARGTPRPTFFEGCPPSPLAPSYASAVAADVSVAEDVGVPSASAKRCSGKGKGGKGGRGGSGSSGGGSSGGGGSGGTGGGSGGFGGGGGASGGSGGGGGSGTGGGGTGAQRVGSGGGQRQQQQRRSETPSPAASIAIFDLDFNAILFAMYALSASAEGDCYQCVPPDLRNVIAALGASESGSLPGRLADPSGGPVVARSSTVLHCPAVPSGSLSGLHLPSFSANLVSTVALQDAMVTTTTPGGQRVTICTCTWTGRHLAKFTRRLGSSLYTLATEPPQVAASAQVSVSGQVAASCSRRLLSHQTLLWHHRLGHPSLPRLRGMHSRLLTLHMDVWGPARVSGHSRECFFLLVVDDYTWYTTVFPLRSKGQVVDVLIPWTRTVRLQLRERFGQDLSVVRLHSDRGGEFSSNLLREFCRGEGILQSFRLPASPQQNGIAERRIGLVMEVAHTSMIYAAAPHFQWPFAVQYAAHQLNLWPRVSLPETSPTLCWTGEVGDASVFRVWGSRAFVRDTFAEKLSPRAIPCVFLGFDPDALGWQFYHPTLRRVFPSQDVTFDESVPFYRLFPYCSAPPPPPPLFLAPGPTPVDPLLPQGPAPSGVSQVDPLRGPAPVQVAVDSGAARGAAYGGAGSGGAEPGGAESEGAETGGGEHGGAEPEGIEPGGASSEGAESGGAEPQGAALSGGSAGASLRLSPQQLREWFVRGARLQSGATGAAGAGAAGAGGAGVAAGAGVTGGTATSGPGGACTRGTGAAGSGGVEGPGARDPTDSGATGAGGSGAGGAGAGRAGVGGTSAGGTGVGGPCVGGAGAGGAGAVDPGGTMRPRLYFVPLLQQDRQEDFECLAAAVPRFASMLLSPEGDPDAPDILTPRSYAVAITVPYSSQWQAAMDAEMASWKFTDTYVDAVPPSRANIVDGIWNFRVKRPLGSSPAFKARYVARGFTQKGVDYFQTFSHTPKMTTFLVLLHVTAQRDYELHSLEFSTAFLQGSLHEEIWLCRPPGFTGSFPAGTQWSLQRLVYGLHQAPCEWHDIVRTTLAALGFDPATADPSLFLRTDTSLPSFYVLVYVDDLVFATADTKALTLVKSELQKRHTYTDLGELCSYLGLQITRDRARRTNTLTQSHMVHQVLQRFGFPVLLATAHSSVYQPLALSSTFG